ncbi:hypothetical protein [uncultured Anaerococcus sp.]|uniref:hypothetical protein n=1 Tax=uncultured Anaerococcus sp. TaxID=293428 RepID=UPI00262D539B|nr:hypothetical protein [uncultured Anaerococcus sp.]
MNRQMRRRVNRNLNLNNKDIDDLAEHFRKENEEANRVIAAQFLALTVEALRLEFGFGQARIDRYTRKVNSLLDSVNLDYLSFEDLLEEISIKPTQILRLDGKAKDKINKRISKGA